MLSEQDLFELAFWEGQKQQDWKIIEAMEKYGGSFVKAIAKACYCADGINYKRLRGEFNEIFIEYYEKFVKNKLTK